AAVATDAAAFAPVAPDAETATPAAAPATDAAAAPVLDLPQAPAVPAADLAAANTKKTDVPVAKAETTAAPAATPAAAPTADAVNVALAAAAPATDTAEPPIAVQTGAAQTAAAQVVAPEVASVTGKVVKAAEQKTPAAAVAANLADAAAEPVAADAVQSAHAATTGEGGAEGQGDSNGSQGAQTAQAAPVAVDATTTTPTFVAPGTTAAPTPIVAANLPVKAAPETVAHLTTEIASKAQVGKTSRFDVVLQPEGLGRVDVRIEIAKDGKLTAALNFDNPQAAADLRGKSGELRQALADAGFNVADNALSFDSSRQNGGQNPNAFFNFQGGEHGRQAFQGRAFQSALAEDPIPLSPSALLPGLRVAERSGVDVKI
ncbi:Flagellar hook-length control protein FliK, partial [Caulobacter sp. AP07]|uniref:flagellar hook-length control protein FliK n=1 Tax=Caulobacter sp. AP07 TaxID=1144304 RepID=UPI000271F318